MVIGRRLNKKLIRRLLNARGVTVEDDDEDDDDDDDARPRAGSLDSDELARIQLGSDGNPWCD